MSSDAPPSGKADRPTAARSAQRWRLVLGRYARPRLGNPQSGEAERLDAVMERLFAERYKDRGVRTDPRMAPGPGSLDPSSLSIPRWLDEVQSLFPRETFEAVVKQGADAFGVDALLQNPKALENLPPSTELLGAVMAMKGRAGGRHLGAIRKLIVRVVEALKEKLMKEVQVAFAGQARRHRPSPLRVAKNFDALATIRRNLKHWNPELGALVVQDPRFFSRVKRHLPWEIILCLDQSGSMAGSVIHAAVMAGILCALPAVRLRLIVFDTSVVDLSEHVTDPVEVLMSVQLGGGTNIGQAMIYAEQLVRQPQRTILVLVTDFGEGADPRVLVGSVKRLRGAGVRLLGLAALDAEAEPFYDRQMAERLAQEGMEIAALTPHRFAEWLAQAIDG